MKTRSDSELSKKNGGIIRPMEILFFFSKHFGLIHLAGLRVPKHFSKKKIIFPSSLSSSCFLFCLASSLFLSSLFSSLDLLFSCLVSPHSSSRVSSLLFHLLLSLLSSFFFSCLLFPCLVFSFLVLSYLLSLCVVVVVVLLLVVVCVCVYVAAR